MDFRRAVMTIVASSIAAVPALAGAHPADSATADRHRRWDELKLTDDQKIKLKDARKEMREIDKKDFEQIKAIRDKSKAELLKPGASKEILYGYAKELGAIHARLAERRTDHLLKVKSILTPEQFSKLVDRFEDMGPGGGMMRGPGCARKGPCPMDDRKCHQERPGAVQ